jgi:XisH protein
VKKTDKPMPRRDIYHYQTKNAFIKDGWDITDDPMQITWEEKDYSPDLGAEKLVAAQKGKEKIAIEIKSFIGQNFAFDFYEAMGQYDSYFFALADLEPDRKVILAISDVAYNKFFVRKYVQRLIQLKHIPVVVIDTDKEIIVKWIK